MQLIAAEGNRIEGIDRCLLICPDGRHQAVHNHIRLLKAFRLRPAENRADIAAALFHVFRNTFIGNRKQDEHRAVFADNRQEPIDLAALERYGIDQRAAGIHPQRRFDDIRVAGIDAERQIYLLRYLFDDLLHHLLLVNPVHAGIDIEHGGTGLLLRHGHLPDVVKILTADCRLQFLLAGRIQPLADRGKRLISSDADNLSL